MRNSLGQFIKGSISPMRGLKSRFAGDKHPQWGTRASLETRAKQRKAWETRKLMPVSQETRQKMSIVRKGKTSPLRGIARPLFLGENHSNWKGGVSTYAANRRGSSSFREWKRHVLQRDNYTCQMCGRNDVALEVDHEMPFRLFPDLHFEVLNGRALCNPCHKKTPTYGWKLRSFLKLHDYA